MNKPLNLPRHQCGNRRAVQIVLAFMLLLLLTVVGTAGLQANTAVPRQPQAVIPICGAISSNTTWTAANLYLAQDCVVTLNAGVTLTIEPGTTVKFLGGQAVFIVNGDLVALGTAVAPITFSSLHDNAHGQTAPGSSGSPAAEDWYGLYFAPGSSGQISHAFVGYGTALAAPPIAGWNKGQIYAESATLQFDHLEVAYGTRPGIYLQGSGGSAHISNSFIHHFSGAASYPFSSAIYQQNINLTAVYSNLSFSNNGRDEVSIDIDPAFTQDVTVGGADTGFICGYSVCQLMVPDGRTLTILPGTTLDFRATYGIGIASGGALLATGTPTQPITFTSRLAANGDLGQYWLGLWAQPGSQVALSHCDISYADDSNYGLGALEINTANAQISNCHIHHNKRNGLYIYSRNGSAQAISLSNVQASHNGQYGAVLHASNGSLNQVTWNGGGMSDNGYAGLWAYNFAGGGLIDATLQNLSINGNGLTPGGGTAGIYAPDANTNLTLTDVTLNDNGGTAVYWQCNGNITAHNLATSGNGANEITLPGCAISGGRAWELGEAGLPVRVANSIELTSGSLLTLRPGTTLRFDKNSLNVPTYLRLQDQSALYALGTAEQPVRFIGQMAEPGWWTGIEALNRANLVLRHCEIGYAGSNYNTAALKIRWGFSDVPTANVQNCEIHHSASKGIHFDFANFANTPAPLIRANNLHDNAEEAIANWNAPPLNARDNYWGDASGPYHPTINPGGLGDAVGDNILFYPWQTTPASGDAPGDLLLSTGAPNLVSPGQTVNYALQYLNLMTETVQNGVLLMQLPRTAEYLSSSGGVYWPENHQVFWLLGAIPPDGQAFLAVQVRFDWGLPADFSDRTIALLSGDNYNADAFDRAVYLGYTAVAPTAVTPLSQAQFAALRAAHPALDALYQEALTAGYSYLEAGSVTYDSGQVVQGAALRTANRQFVRLLTLMDGQALATTVGGGYLTLHDATGGMREHLQTHERTFWGNWVEKEANGRLPTACTESKCKFHCIGKTLSLKVVGGAASKAFFWTIATGGTGGLISGGYQIYSITRSILECKNACDVNPYSGCCDAEGQVRWSPGLLPGYCGKAYCNANSGTWGLPGQLPCDGVCVAGIEAQGGGCKACAEDTRQTQGIMPLAVCASGGSCTDTGLLLARDPNAIYGPQGELLPGQTVTYTITYENEGAGRAYGVYVLQPLTAVFDESSLTFTHGAGVYLPQSRELFWWVGELGPQGAPDASGAITYTVQLTGGLPSGAVVASQATVYFSSVPEETPTNTWVNVVAPLVATPQTVSTAYQTPLAITLNGRDISGLPLTYEVVTLPRGGALTGVPPNLVYAPYANFTGADGFDFRVSNGVSTSNPAQISILVTTEGDSTPPQILWAEPPTGAVDVSVSATPIFSDALGPLYAPAVLAGLSEALDEGTVNTGTVLLTQAGGAPVPARVQLDAASNQIVLFPRRQLATGQYTAWVTTAVTDRAGNGLAQPYSWSFTAVGAETGYTVYLPFVRRP